MKVTLNQALVLWLKHRSDNLLTLLISGAATKPEVKKLLVDHTSSRNNPIRRKAFHGNYRNMFPGRKTKPIAEQNFTLK